jgi:exonuclease V
MLSEDVEAGLYVPIELLLLETENGAAKCVAQLPSGLIAGHEAGTSNQRLVKAVAELDQKLLGLIEELMK